MIKRFLLGVLLALVFVPTLIYAQLTDNTGNNSAILLKSAAYTAATVNSSDQRNSLYHGIHIIVEVTAYTSGTYTPHIQAKNPATGTYYDLLVGPAIGATGVTVLKVAPGITTVANGAAADILPLTWRVSIVGASSQSMTFSVGAFLVK